MKVHHFLLVFALVAFATTSAWSATVAVSNSGFESPGNAPSGSGGTIPGWTDGDGAGTQAGTFNPTASRYPLTSGATEGSNVAFSNGPTISQVLTTNYTAGTLYTLQVDVGDRNDTAFPGFDVQLRSGGVAVGSANEFDISVPNGGFGTATIQFTASPGFVNNGSPIEIFLNSDGPQTNFDNVRLDASPVSFTAPFSISVLNPSFESPGNGPGGFGGVIPGWTDGDGAGTGAGTFNPTASRYPLTGGATDGDDVAFSNGPAISQVLGDVLEASTIYTLQVDVGDRNDTAFPGFDIQLLAGGNVLGSVDETTLSVPNGGFATALIEFLADGSDPNLGQNLEIRLLSNGGQTNFDNVRLTAQRVPEPSTIFLWAIVGLIGLACATGRRRWSIGVSSPA